MPHPPECNPRRFLRQGSRFGVHEINRQIYPPPYYGRLLIVAMFNAGLQVWDIRAPYNPRRVAYFIQAPNKIPAKAAEPIRATHYRRKATYNLDRAGAVLTTSGFTPSRSACWRGDLPGPGLNAPVEHDERSVVMTVQLTNSLIRRLAIG
ncbi:MAG: hypothetical protein WA728_32125 [Xanthobacteraceae bacterium]